MSDQIRGNRKAIAAWCVYDWANSAFTTLVVTFVYAAYFAQHFAPDENTGTALWSRGIVVSSILIALLSPTMGAIADRGGNRRRYLIGTTLLCVIATAVLAFITPETPHPVLTALTVFVIANVMFEMGIVFYNSFLPSLVSQDKIGRVSGYGWGLGYIGGLGALVVALVAFVGINGEPLLPVSSEAGANLRASNFLVAAWFLVFSLPMFLYVRDPEGPKARMDIRGALGDLAQTFRDIRRYREVVKFLLARLVYNDGLVTVFAFSGLYAVGTFDFSARDLLVFAIVMNLAAGTGAAVFGFMDDKGGGKATIAWSLVALTVGAVIAILAPNRLWFWIAAFIIGIFVGPNQSASRSLMGRFVPEKHQAEFFGFFAFSGKATAFLGPLLLGILAGAFNQRVGFSVVILFFIVGGVILATVDERAGIAAAKSS
jgi:UMF1 family MFS transporter